MKKIFLLFCLIAFISSSHSQRIYGFADKYFVSTDLTIGSRDTLITFSGQPWINMGFRSAIDQYNGRYFFGGSIPGISGQFHIINIYDLSIESFPFYPENMEYDYIRNKIVYEKSGSFYSINLNTMELTNLGVVDTGNSICYGQIRAYRAQGQHYMYIDYKDGWEGAPYYLLVDATSGELICEKKVEMHNGFYYTGGGYVTNIHTGDFIGHSNGRYGIVSPCDGTMTKLSQIEDYYAHLNNQMAVYDHANNLYIIPYYSTNNSDLYKFAIVDIYNDEILETISQPWEGRMDLQQIYDQPLPLIININDTLFVPKGNSYNWYLDDEFLGSTTENYWVPLKNGNYRCIVEFMEYSSTSPVEVIDNISSVNQNNPIYYKYYPNPTREMISIFDHCGDITSIEIMDIHGKLHRSVEIKNNHYGTITINTSSLTTGIYTLKINTNSGCFSEKLVKQ